MRIHIMDLQVGDRLISDTYNQFGLHILSANTVLDSTDIAKLFQHSIDYVDIEHRGLEAYEAESSNSAMHVSNLQVLNNYEGALTGIKGIFEQVAQDGQIDEEMMQESFDPLVQHFRKEKDIVSLLLTLNNKDDYTYQHSVQVGMLAYYISKWMNHSESDCLLAGQAGYLHDIGKSRIPESILKKPSRLTDDEYEEIKHHTTYGHEIILKSLGSKVFALAALQHHERLDGTGYPNRLKAKDIHPIAKVIAVADVYSAMISTRVYQEKRDLLSVLKELHRCSFTELDPDIVQTFIRHMAPNFIGKKVLLKSGELGRVVYINPTDPFRPLVKLKERFVDLSKEHSLEIKAIHM
jgi:putative nucleotidyltransferase with HDIG domain